LPFEDASFDTVLNTQVIEHVADHQAMLYEAFRVLKSNGVLILSGPMYWPLHEEPYDFFRFTEHGLRYLLEQTGFTEIEIKASGGQWALCGQVFIHALAKTKFRRSIVTRIINQIFGTLEDRWPNPGNPIGYLAVAKKANVIPSTNN
jgi:SAM-dependent methyltransferase